MSIYEYQTFKIDSLSDAKLIIKKFAEKKINLLHNYESVIYQGPDFIKTLNKKLKHKNVNYIVELNDNIGLILTMISIEINILAISQKIKKEVLSKILSIAKIKKIKILYVEELKKLDLV